MGRLREQGASGHHAEGWNHHRSPPALWLDLRLASRRVCREGSPPTLSLWVPSSWLYLCLPNPPAELCMGRLDARNPRRWWSEGGGRDAGEGGASF